MTFAAMAEPFDQIGPAVDNVRSFRVRAKPPDLKNAIHQASKLSRAERKR